ncbi:MAG TPA: hypothetical protein VKY19_00115 [Ktedonosporobacter sp.]|jgi:hypothetical protein|nr:hypothetical protein [Ktedonosporobacter sp.]
MIAVKQIAHGCQTQRIHSGNQEDQENEPEDDLTQKTSRIHAHIHPLLKTAQANARRHAVKANFPFDALCYLPSTRVNHVPDYS